jgi:hypothetical protein
MERAKGWIPPGRGYRSVKYYNTWRQNISRSLRRYHWQRSDGKLSPRTSKALRVAQLVAVAAVILLIIAWRAA